MKNKIVEMVFEFYEIMELETSPKQCGKISKEIGVWTDAYEEERDAIIESRERAKKARQEAILLATADAIGAGVLPFLARQNVENGSTELVYERAKKFSKEAQKTEFLLLLWQAATENKEAGGLKTLLQEDKDGKWDITLKSLVALYNATKDDF